MGGAGRDLVFASKPPTVILMAGLQGSGKTTAVGKLARHLREEHGKDVAVAACDVYRPAAVEQLIKVGAQAGATVYEQGTGRDPVDIAEWALDRAREENRDVLIIDTSGPPPHRRGADGGAAQDPQAHEAAQRAARGRRDDRPGRGERVAAVRRGGELRRRDPHEARRRRPRRRGAVGEGGHREADPVRLDGREARRVRALPPRPDGAADPRHGRRAHAGREGRAPDGREAGRGARAQDPQAAVHARRLPRPDAPDPARWDRSRAS